MPIGMTLLGFQRSPRLPATGAKKPYMRMFRENIMAVLPRPQPNSSRIEGKKTENECLMP
jgi:hypothetical protein